MGQLDPALDLREPLRYAKRSFSTLGCWMAKKRTVIKSQTNRKDRIMKTMSCLALASLIAACGGDLQESDEPKVDKLVSALRGASCSVDSQHWAEVTANISGGRMNSYTIVYQRSGGWGIGDRNNEHVYSYGDLVYNSPDSCRAGTRCNRDIPNRSGIRIQAVFDKRDASDPHCHMDF